MTNNKYKILLVEDDENIRNLVATMLEATGYQVLLAESCSMAKLLYSSYLPDLILLDLGLPDMDGMELLNFVREHSLTPVIVLSARAEENDKVSALDSGANDYVTKPFGSAELLARVRTALRNHRFSSDSGRLPGGKFIL
ncbi:MAG: response regulator, partial [Oscillospiraceae bacterium]|nr:response regulator [Oscillospiraceae bacterium]